MLALAAEVEDYTVDSSKFANVWNIYYYMDNFAFDCRDHAVWVAYECQIVLFCIVKNRLGEITYCMKWCLINRLYGLPYTKDTNIRVYSTL